MEDWHKLGFSTPIQENAFVNNDFVIRGVAISETTTHNNHRYIAEELEKATPSLIGKPLLVDHDNRVESIKGRVVDSIFDKNGRHIRFEAKIMDKNIQEMIKDGRLNSVSIGAFATDLIKEEDGGITAKGIKIVELSLVAVPADENANFAMAMDKSYQIKESSIIKEITEAVSELNNHIDVRRLNEMSEKEEKVDESLSERNKILEELSLLKATNKQLVEDKRKSLIEAYKKLCQEKSVKDKDLTNVSEETIRMLIEQVSDIVIADKKEFKSEVAEKLPVEMTNFVIETGNRGTAVWEMPDMNAWRKLHTSITRGKTW